MWDRGMLLSVPKLSTPTQGKHGSMEMPTVSAENQPCVTGTFWRAAHQPGAGLVKQEERAL